MQLVSMVTIPDVRVSVRLDFECPDLRCEAIREHTRNLCISTFSWSKGVGSWAEGFEPHPPMGNDLFSYIDLHVIQLLVFGVDTIRIAPRVRGRY